MPSLLPCSFATCPQVRAFLIKFIMTVITYGIGWSRVHNILLLLLAWYHTWMYLKWVRVCGPAPRRCLCILHLE